MPLYKVEVSFEFVVVAENEEEAKIEAKNEINSNNPDISISEVFCESDLPYDWDEEDIPYGCKGEKTIAEIIDEEAYDRRHYEDGTPKPVPGQLGIKGVANDIPKDYY